MKVISKMRFLNHQSLVLLILGRWCGPCKNLTPILEEISVELKGKIKIAKVNIDDNQELAAKFSIRSIPTMIIFKDGENIDTKVGLPPKNDLLEWIESSS